MDKKIVLNLSLVFFSFAIVLFIRTETLKTSYTVMNQHKILKNMKAENRILQAKYNHQSGAESLVAHAQGMVALKALQPKQVVRVDTKGFLRSR